MCERLRHKHGSVLSDLCRRRSPHLGNRMPVNLLMKTESGLEKVCEMFRRQHVNVAEIVAVAPDQSPTQNIIWLLVSVANLVLHDPSVGHEPFNVVSKTKARKIRNSRFFEGDLLDFGRLTRAC